MDKIGEKLHLIGEYMLRVEKNTFFADSIDNSHIIACINSSFIDDNVSAFINPPCDEEGLSYPELAIAYVLLNDGEVWCRTSWGHEYNLRECVGETIDTVLRVVKGYYEKNKKRI